MSDFTLFLLFPMFTLFTKFPEMAVIYITASVWFLLFLIFLKFSIFTKFTEMRLPYMQTVLHIKDRGYERSLRTLSIFRIMDI